MLAVNICGVARVVSRKKMGKSAVNTRVICSVLAQPPASRMRFENLGGHTAFVAILLLQFAVLVSCDSDGVPETVAARDTIEINGSIAASTWQNRSCSCVYIKGATESITDVPFTENCIDKCPMTRKERALCAVASLVGTDKHLHSHAESTLRIQCANEPFFKLPSVFVGGLPGFNVITQFQLLAGGSGSPHIIESWLNAHNLSVVELSNNHTNVTRDQAVRMISRTLPPEGVMMASMAPTPVGEAVRAIVRSDWAVLYCLRNLTDHSTLAFALTKSVNESLPEMLAPLVLTHVYSAVNNVTVVDSLLLTVRLRPVVNWCNFKNDVDKVDLLLTPKAFSQSISMGGYVQERFYNRYGFMLGADMDTLTVNAEVLISASQPMHVQKFFPAHNTTEALVEVSSQSQVRAEGTP